MKYIVFTPCWSNTRIIWYAYSFLVKLFLTLNLKCLSHDDTLKPILNELGGIPLPDNEELKDARDTQITLELTNRFAHVQGTQMTD